MFHESRGVGADDGPHYFGPPQPGQSFAQYESFMSVPIAVSAGGALIGLLLSGPIGAIAVGSVGFFAATKMKKKPTTQGG